MKKKKNYFLTALIISIFTGLFISLMVYWNCDMRQSYGNTSSIENVLRPNGTYDPDYI